LFCNVAFGDLNFTDLGKTCLPESVRRNSKAVHQRKASYAYIFTFFLSDKFKDFKVDNTIFEKSYFIQRIHRNKMRDRLKAENSAPARVQNAIMAN
jgi:hypothetical protein